jgi:hypothetical protein
MMVLVGCLVECDGEVLMIRETCGESLKVARYGCMDGYVCSFDDEEAVRWRRGRKFIGWTDDAEKMLEITSKHAIEE